MTTENADVSTKQLFSAQLAVHKQGGTIDDLMQKIDPNFEGMEDESRKKRIATINVRRSQILSKLKGEYLAKRSVLEKDLESAGSGVDDVSNDIREQIRLLNREEAALVGTFKLTRKGRTGDVAGVSLSDMFLEVVTELEE